jgi:hypothetical protein
MPRKVFTAGEVLAAADVQSFLMDQSVQTFAGTAARGSAVPSPTEGMMSYLNDTNDIQVYNGSAYTSTLGAVLVGSATASGSSFFINNCFSSQYTNYLIKFKINVTSNSRLVFNFTAGGSVLETNIYRVNYVEGATTRTVLGGNASSDFIFMDTGLTTGATYTADVSVFTPFTSNNTHGIFNGVSTPSAIPSVNRPYAFESVGVYDATTSVDGIRFLVFSGTMSGTVEVYGLRN